MTLNPNPVSRLQQVAACAEHAPKEFLIWLLQQHCPPLEREDCFGLTMYLQTAFELRRRLAGRLPHPNKLTHEFVVELKRAAAHRLGFELTGPNSGWLLRFQEWERDVLQVAVSAMTSNPVNTRLGRLGWFARVLSPHDAAALKSSAATALKYLRKFNPEISIDDMATRGLEAILEGERPPLYFSNSGTVEFDRRKLRDLIKTDYSTKSSVEAVSNLLNTADEGSELVSDVQDSREELDRAREVIETLYAELEREHDRAAMAYLDHEYTRVERTWEQAADHHGVTTSAARSAQKRVEEKLRVLADRIRISV